MHDYLVDSRYLQMKILPPGGMALCTLCPLQYGMGLPKVLR